MQEDPRLADLPKPTAHQFTSQRLTLNYWDWGNTDKPLLLLIHGGEDHARSWDWVAERLCADWRIVAPDLRGHGDSEWASDGHYSFESAIVDIAALVDHLGGGAATIVAHSLGGAITLRYAGLYPETVRKLVVMEGLATIDNFVPPPKDDADSLARWRGWVDRRRALSDRTGRRYATLADAVARMRQRNPHLSETQAHHLAEWGLRQDDDGLFRWKFDPMIRSYAPNDATDPLRLAMWSAITCPVLLVHGAESFASNPSEDGRAAMFRDARVISYAGAGHWMHHDRLDDFVTDLQEFLATPAPQ